MTIFVFEYKLGFVLIVKQKIFKFFLNNLRYFPFHKTELSLSALTAHSMKFMFSEICFLNTKKCMIKIKLVISGTSFAEQITKKKLFTKFGFSKKNNSVCI